MAEKCKPLEITLKQAIVFAILSPLYLLIIHSRIGRSLPISILLAFGVFAYSILFIAGVLVNFAFALAGIVFLAGGILAILGVKFKWVKGC